MAASRRGLLLSAPLLTLPHFATPSARAAPFTKTASAAVLDEPMRRLRLPAGTLGRDYVLMQLKLEGKGPFDFVVDTGLTAELITPHLQDVLGLPPPSRLLQNSIGAGGAAQLPLVQLKDAHLVGAEDLSIPTLNAVVTSFIQEKLDPQHPVEGMLGMELLEQWDVDFDFPASRIRLYKPGQGAEAAQKAGLVEVPAAVLNETGILGIRTTTPKGAGQPFVGIIDCGASFSALNWKAAALAGLPPRGDAAYQVDAQGRPQSRQASGGVGIIGMDGRPQVAPTTKVQFTFAGAPLKAGGGGMAFEEPPRGWRPWQPVQAAVGDLPVFAQLLGDGTRPFDGPAAVLGLDVLSQRRLVVCAGVNKPGRARQLFVGKA